MSKKSGGMPYEPTKTVLDVIWFSTFMLCFKIFVLKKDLFKEFNYIKSSWVSLIIYQVRHL